MNTSILVYSLIGSNVFMILVFLMFLVKTLTKKEEKIVEVEDTFIYDGVDYKKCLELLASISELVVNKHFSSNYRIPEDLASLKEMKVLIYNKDREEEILFLLSIAKTMLSKKYMNYYTDKVFDVEALLSYYISELYNKKMDEVVAIKYMRVSNELNDIAEMNENLNNLNFDLQNEPKVKVKDISKLSNVEIAKYEEEIRNLLNSKKDFIERFDDKAYPFAKTLKHIASGGEYKWR